MKHIQPHWPLDKVVSGAQTGVDIAGLVAAVKLGIPCVGTLPRGYIQRGFDGVDKSYTKQQIEGDIIAMAERLV